MSPATGRESFGIVLLEAMAAGAPIVASDIHGYKGVVRRGERVCSSRRASRASWPRRSTRLLRRPGLRAEMGAAGMARAEDFSWPRVTAKVEEYYGFVIRRLAAAGALPPASRAESLRRPPVRARPSASSDAARRARRAALRATRAARPGGVGDHQAGHGERDRQDRSAASAAASSSVRVDRADRELEGVQVGRQQALVGVDDRRGQRQRRDVRVQDHEPADGRDDRTRSTNRRASRAADDLGAEVGERQATTSAIGSTGKLVRVRIAVSGRRRRRRAADHPDRGRSGPSQRTSGGRPRPRLRRAEPRNWTDQDQHRPRGGRRPGRPSAGEHDVGDARRAGLGARVHGRRPRRTRTVAG